MSLYKPAWLLMLLEIISGQAMAIEEIAVIATRTATATSDLPGSISVLDDDDLKQLSSVHIQQAMSQLPGVNYQRGNGQESLPSIRSAVLTGAGACGNVLVLEEAIPVRGSGLCNVNELFDTHSEQAQSIEVVRGANTAFYGSNALLGSINIRLAAEGTNQFSLELGENDYIRAKAALSYGKPDESHGRIYVTVAEDGGYRDDSGYQQQKFSWRHQLSFQDWELALGATATYLDQETAGFVVGLDSYRDPVLRKQNLDPEAFRKSDSIRAWATFSRDVNTFFGEQSRLQITPYVRSTEMDFLQHFLPGDPLEQNEQSALGWQTSLTTKVSESLNWSMGFDAEFADGELLQTQDQATRGSAFLQATIPSGTHYDYQVDVQQLAVFAHMNWQLADGWKVIAGGRLESIEYQYDNRALDGRTRDDGTECGFGGCRYSRPADRNDDFTHFSPKLELQYEASPNWQWHIAIADAYRAPQATELYRLQRAQTQANLDEVSATHFEVGGDWSNTQTQLAFAAYQINQRNVIIRDSDFFNVDGQRIDSTGFEVSLRHQFNDHWSMRAASSIAEHKYDSDQLIGDVNIRGKLVDTAPKFIANAALDWRINSSLSTQVELQHTSKYYLDPENKHQYPGHTLVNLRGQYQVNDQWSVAMRLLNVSNRLYAERADFTSFTDERYFPGEPRSLFAELKWQY